MLTLLPIPGSPFLAKFSGPYSVVKQVSERDYLVSTPDRRRSTQLCHINLLKPYFCRSSLTGGGADAEVKPVGVASVGEPVQSVSCGMVAECCEEDVCAPDDSVFQPRLKNSEMLADLTPLLGHLPEENGKELKLLISEFPALFDDTPSRTHLIEHDIEVGDAAPIRQRFYRVSPEKGKC